MGRRALDLGEGERVEAMDLRYVTDDQSRIPTDADIFLGR
jgi:hypothetical protein